jgi:predicted phosphodiesterase
MVQPTPPVQEIERVAHLYQQACERGCAPIGKTPKFGHLSAVQEVVAATGMLDGAVRRRLKHAARLGLVKSDPPRPGFVLTKASTEIDQFGAIKREWIGTRPEPGEVFEVPAGHVVKGESALVDPDGRVLVKWVKTGSEKENSLVPALLQAFEEHKGQSIALPAPEAADDNALTVYPVFDLHLGQFSWPKESGDDYSVDIAVKMANDAIGKLVVKSDRTGHAVVIFGGDYFHSNDAKAETPGSGHALDVDGRWPKVYLAGAKCAISLVDLVAAGHPSVEVVVLEGNHDRDAAVALRICLALFFENQSRITVNMGAGIAWYRRFGAVLMGATHGHTMKPDRMAMMLAVDRAEDWGVAKHRHFFFGHIHHETAKEVAGVRVESFQSPAGKDSFNAAHGYRSGRSMSSITFRAEEGEDNRQRVSIR